MADEYQEMTDVLKALAHPIRIRIVEFLMGGERCVKEIWEEMNIPQPTASQHINVLKNARVISYRKNGIRTCYRIENERVKKIINILKEE